MGGGGCYLGGSWWYSRRVCEGMKNNKFWEELIACFPWYDTGCNEKRRIQQFFCCCMCICYHGNISTELLPSKDRGIFTEPLPSKDMGDTQAHTHTQTAIWSHKPTSCFQNKESRLKIHSYSQIQMKYFVFALFNRLFQQHPSELLIQILKRLEEF
jgi:hypothetical protein